MIVVLMFCFVLLFVAVAISFIRLFGGPTLLDRVVAFDSLVASIVGMLILYSVYREMSYFLEILLVLSLLGFTSTVAIIDYLFHCEGESHD